ncbi:phosphate/phosphite/phosphonate ABC transporter substrate-binding protein [Palleronia sp. KMU-117]|uniref:phosphate/phosphite/phosphonate ABC transporter substrate-binding protein n=1 Tax=Palleronia sp. KMU-117 TaxID=3434108 RepID=UPI003D72931A
MSVVATLPMYDWPETRGAVEAFYAALRAQVPELPPQISRPDSEAALNALWRDPALLLGQTCWGPLRHGLSDHVEVLAQPTYDDVPGGRGIFYRSAIVMREGPERHPPVAAGAVLPQGLAALRPAINGPRSLSGAIALSEDLSDPGLAARALVTGSHRASVRAVADGLADFAAIDCRSWALALAHEPAARGLTVAGWTALRPGLPFITSRRTPPALRVRLAAALVGLGAERPALAA